MPTATILRIIPASLIVLVLLSSDQPAIAGPPQGYSQSGTVISIAHDLVFSYRIETRDRMYTMACYRTRIMQIKPSQCDWNSRPIAVGDVVQFRIDGDKAYMPKGTDGEERFIVEMTELKQLPPLPASPQPGSESAVVLGLGYAPDGGTALSALSGSSTNSMLPVVAVPTTGGPPVVVIPTAPAAGPVVTGVPATGGAPITAISVAPNISSGQAATETKWIHVLRLETASKIYDLACLPRACRVNGNVINQGDLFTVRLQKKWAYVSTSANSRDQRFAIISVRSLEDSTAGFPLAN